MTRQQLLQRLFPDSHVALQPRRAPKDHSHRISDKLIVRAIDQLSAGRTISRVSADAGFTSAAAFSFAFRQVTTMTPTAFLNGWQKN